ncbi:phosphoglycolate phosphatase [Methanofollis formosanus]|uniref:Phosphoglycolate phosphatase n=1 Tax=Methanofollis formosanus TaxID=299308 RepID=A0A8G1EF83_9EURY|nr:phosphoglycolate phosphatase [Methanofollis formosanus]QYZ78525.1 phosphoglycolate phosphatase [Methanofollis formosanus]
MLKAVVTDLDGTLTDRRRRISTAAIEAIRNLVDAGVPVVLASGNTTCSLDILCKMIGTDGSIIGENGGVYRYRFDGKLQVAGRQEACWDAYHRIEEHFAEEGKALTLYSPENRFADVAFARTVSPAETAEVIADMPVRAVDTGFAIHLQYDGVTKGSALAELAALMDLVPDDFLAIGDSENDTEMIRRAGVGAAVGNAVPGPMAAAEYVAEKKYGEGFVEIVRKYRPYFLER